jgi:hydrogenase large subunit
MSYGAYRQQGEPAFRQGLWDETERLLDTTLISEDVSHSWMAHQMNPRHPYEGMTIPDAEDSKAYSWCKAPRLDGRVVEVGALARQQVDGHPLIRALVEESGGNVLNRVIARALEIARVVIQMESWVREIQPDKVICHHKPFPREARGYGLVEAARGSLGHWVKIRNGRILNYQIIAPTTWNFSPRDREGQPGALELALVNAPLRPGEKDPVSVQHIVRSFDPCMVCTVH